MTDNNKIFDDKYRENFLRTANPLALNDYLKNMQRLSKKGGKYLEMYNKDMIYLLDLNDTVFQDEGNMGTIFSTAPQSQNIATEQPQNTEVYIGRLTNITEKTIPAPQSPFITIKNILLNPNSSLEDKNKAINNFIDNLMNNNSVFIQEYNETTIKQIKELSNIIAKNIELMKYAFMYLTKVLQTSRNKVSEDFMKSYMELRNNKSLPTYNTLKDKLMKEYISKVGTEKVYTSKFVEKVINSFKQAKSKGQI